MNPGAEIRSDIGPAIPAQPAAPLELEFSVPSNASKRLPLKAVVLVHLQCHLISKSALYKLRSLSVERERGDAPLLIPNLKGGHYIVQDKVTLTVWKKDDKFGYQETFYVEKDGDDGEAWDPEIDVILSPEKTLFQGLGQWTSIQPDRERDYVLGVFFFTADNNYQIRRQLAVTFKGHVDVLPDTIQRELNIRMEPYSGPPVPLVGRQVQPIGTITVPWKLVGRHKVYWTTFYVIHDDKPCVPHGWLGRPSVMEHGLFNVYEDR